ncbi:MAG: ribosome recycling factor [Verrucomicrobia bacterium]|jgi:ribosome recycling factor|nr:ribosome recycling factor [Verrucomicrobiota bacterium]MDA1203784.1 ribosome recycling factor [Verrucomicrobiota bacterium]
MDEILFTAEEGMDKALDFMKHEFSSVRTGKASPALVEGIEVDAYGSVMKLKQLALISTPEPRLIVIQPFDASTLKPIEKAINESKIGITPSVDGKLIRLPVPELSEERRKDLVKTLKNMAEETRVRMRAARRHAMETAKKMQKEGALTEDNLKSAETQIQKLTDKFVADVDAQLVAKEGDIMKI